MNPTVGQQLRSAREKLGISLADAAHETHIRLNYLQELENDHPELLHSAAQARGFLRLYADYLRLPYVELLSGWDEAEDALEKAESKTQADNAPSAWFKNLVPHKEQENEPAVKTELQPEQPQGASMPIEGEGMQEEAAQDLSEPIESEAGEPQPVSELAEEPTSVETQLSAEEPAGAQRSAASIQQAIASLGARISHWEPLRKLLRRGDANAAQGQASDTGAKAAPAQKSEDIFKQIGLSLQNRRRMMDLNLSDIENFTNLKHAFLVALEDGRFGDLPSTVQGRGMLNNYAKFLGMEESSVMELYGQALQLQREERLQPQRKPVKPPITVRVNLPEKWRKVINPDLIIGSTLIIGLFAFIIWGATQVFSNSSGASTEAPSISEVLQVTPSLSPAVDLTATFEAQASVETTPLPGMTVLESTPTVLATVNSAPLQVYIIAHDRAYLKADVDGKEVFNGRVSPNNVYTYSGNSSISLLTGNASALEVYFNQEYIGQLGGVGEVKKIDFTLQGLSTPTPAATRTPTPTPNMATQQAADAASRQ